MRKFMEKRRAMREEKLRRAVNEYLNNNGKYSIKHKWIYSLIGFLISILIVYLIFKTIY
jgi:hypothetical protein